MSNTDLPDSVQHFEKPDALIFDWDGTLTSTEALFRNSLKATFQHMGQLDDFPEQMPAISTQDFFKLIFQSRAPEAERHYYSLITARHLVEMTVMEGVPEFLEYLASTDLRLFVLSNKRGPILRAEIEHLGWAPFFEKVVGSMDAPQDKPSVTAVDYTLAGTSIELGANIWFIGDTSVDMECAYNIDATPILVDPSGEGARGFSEFSPRISVQKCLDLKNILSRIL